MKLLTHISADLLLGVEQNVDMIFASFIRKRQDVKDIRKVLGDRGKHILIVSKIENHEGVTICNHETAILLYAIYNACI